MLNPDTYDPKPKPRYVHETMCPHCYNHGYPTNHYLYRCYNIECGRYF